LGGAQHPELVSCPINQLVRDLLQVKAEPISDFCSAFVKTCLRKSEKQWTEEEGEENRMRNNRGDTETREGG